MTDTAPNMVGVPVHDRGTWMQLREGRRFYPLDPKPEEVFIEDIALSLSRQIRYNGLSDDTINVAHHSINAAWIADMEGCSPAVQLAALMHDAPETYVSDIIRPLKSVLPEYQAIENRIMDVINVRFDLPIVEHKLLKHFDNLCLSWEKRDLYPSSEEWPMMLDVPTYCEQLKPWDAKHSELVFLFMFDKVRSQIASLL